jgi:hypothetical protein
LLQAAADADRRKEALIVAGNRRTRPLTLEEKRDIDAAEVACKLAYGAVRRWRMRHVARTPISVEEQRVS